MHHIAACLGSSDYVPLFPRHMAGTQATIDKRAPMTADSVSSPARRHRVRSCVPWLRQRCCYSMRTAGARPPQGRPGASRPEGPSMRPPPGRPGAAAALPQMHRSTHASTGVATPTHTADRAVRVYDPAAARLAACTRAGPRPPRRSRACRSGRPPVATCAAAPASQVGARMQPSLRWSESICARMHAGRGRLTTAQRAVGRTPQHGPSARGSAVQARKASACSVLTERIAVRH